MPKRKKESNLNVINPFAGKFKVKTSSSGKEATVSTSVSNNLNNQDMKKPSEVEILLQDPTEIKQEPHFNLFVGTNLGILKGISLEGDLPISKTVYRLDGLRYEAPCVQSLTWADDTEKELLVTFSNHVVKAYNTKLSCFTRQTPIFGVLEDDISVGLCCHDPENYVVGLENGKLVMWNLIDCKVSLEIKTGGSMSKLKQCPSDRNIYATGGKESDLKIWDFSSEKPAVPLFKAKNVPHDELDLRQPVWVQDITFLPRTSEVVAVGTRYGQVRLYDVRAGNRPVSNVKFLEQPIMAISSTMDERQVIVGTSHGEAGRFDLRNPGKERLLLKYHGYSGGIRCIAASQELPYFVSCGLDRHLYVHEFSKKSPIHKLYIKQQSNCIALSKTFMVNYKGGQKKTKQDDVAVDYANIPPDVLNLGVVPASASLNSPASPTKKARKSKVS